MSKNIEILGNPQNQKLIQSISIYCNLHENMI